MSLGSSTGRAPTTGVAVAQASRTTVAARSSARRAAVVLLCGLALSVVASIVANDIDRRSQLAAFEARTEVLVKRFEQKMLVPLEILHGLAGLFEASDDVTIEEFRAFAEPALQRHRNVSGLLWVPRVSKAERAAHVARARTEVADYELRDGPNKRDATAPLRDEYHPIYYIVPEQPAVLGIDLSGDELRRGWVRDTYKSGLFVTPRVELPTANGTEAAVGAYVPVRKSGEPLGLVVASFRMAKFVEEVFTKDDLRGVELMLFEQGDKGMTLVYSTAGDVVDRDAARGRNERTFQLGNRTWSVAFQGTEKLGTRIPVVVMIAGTIGSALVALLVFLLSRLRALDDGARKLGQYELLEVLGEGGMGTVHRARHVLLRRPTAVKVIRPEVAERESLRGRFEREVHAASQLSHPNNIVVYDYGETPDGELYYAMELVDGIDLHRMVDRHGPQPVNRVAHMLELVAGALAEAHERGIVHRDIKPANIMLSRCGGIFDFPKVLDFGLALTRETDARELTLDGAVLGTPHFMAPEQGLGAADVGPAADIYALGCVAYFLLSGHNLFEAPTVRSLVGKHMTANPIPLGEMAHQDLDPDVEAAVMRCLAKAPGERPAARELAREVAACAATWTNEDAASWWDQHATNPGEPAVSSAPHRVLTVRLADRTHELPESESQAKRSD